MINIDKQIDSDSQQSKSDIISVDATPEIDNGHITDELKSKLLLAIHKGNKSDRAIAREYDVHHSTVSNLRGKQGLTSPSSNQAKRQRQIDRHLPIVEKACNLVKDRLANEADDMTTNELSQVASRHEIPIDRAITASEKADQPAVTYTPDPGMRMLINLQVINKVDKTP